ncbi:ankyrin [Rhizopus microsporus var. microsporus]|uniref:Ankyrin n=1 Tax=Rhizopus microsporus var. microsporus TaxID=86635 RepID=A0A1X0RHV3_RHIZD|nr:ankyrin [Rhizopus microsporus var. microsporus]
MNDEEGATNDDLMLAACRNDQDEMLEDILKEGDFDINYTDGLGDTACHYAAKFGAKNCLELLVHISSIDLNRKNKEGKTPLHLAAQYDDDPDIALDMVDLLLGSGADPRIKDNQGSTILDHVVNEDMRDLIEQSLAGYNMGMSDNDDEDEFI